MNCLLCKSDKIKLIEKIAKKDLVKLYLKKYKIDTSYLFKTEYVDLCECDICKLQFFSPYSGGDEKFYTHFQKYGWYYLEEKKEYDFAAKLVKPMDKVLEIGSGKGVFAKKISSNNYTGLEFSKTACELAAKENVNVINESIEDHSQKNNGQYDIVCNFQVLEHVKDVHSFLLSCVNSLKVGGHLIVSVPSNDSFMKYITNAYLNLPPHHVSRWNDQALEYLARIFGLKLVSNYHEPLDEIHDHMYLRTLLENSIKDLFGIKFRIIDLSLKQKLVSLFSFVFSKLFIKGMRPEMRPKGHSVVAVYQKI